MILTPCAHAQMDPYVLPHPWKIRDEGPWCHGRSTSSDPHHHAHLSRVMCWFEFRDANPTMMCIGMLGDCCRVPSRGLHCSAALQPQRTDKAVILTPGICHVCLGRSLLILISSPRSCVQAR